MAFIDYSVSKQPQSDFERMANLANMRYSNLRKPSLKELMEQSSDPFYHAGMDQVRECKRIRRRSVLSNWNCSKPGKD